MLINYHFTVNSHFPSNKNLPICLEKYKPTMTIIAKSGKPLLSLQQFILKQEVKNLYRHMLRTAREVPDKNYQDELKNWIRTEFRQNSNHTDETVIKMYVQYGKRCLRELESSVSLAK